MRARAYGYVHTPGTVHQVGSVSVVRERGDAVRIIMYFLLVIVYTDANRSSTCAFGSTM